MPVRREILKDFGLNDLSPIYLLGTGANGVNKHKSLVKAFKREKIKCQIIAMCGKNSELLEELKKEGEDENVMVIGIPQIEADLMVQLLKISTWIFARPGAGLTTEAIVTGCPVIFDTSRGIMPQEYNNLNFWRKHAKSLICCSSAKQVVEVVLTKKETLPPSTLLHLPLDDSPSTLLDKLEALAN